MISTVAVGTDGSATAGEAVEMAAALAERFGAKLAILSAFPSGDPGGASVPDELQWTTSSSARVREILARTEDGLRRRGIECATLVDEGDPGEVLVQLAAECGADVLVVGSKGMQRRVLGSVPNTVTHKAACSVFVVKTS